MSRRIGVIGVPTSAGAFAPGQENAPRALREAGFEDGSVLREESADLAERIRAGRLFEGREAHG